MRDGPILKRHYEMAANVKSGLNIGEVHLPWARTTYAVVGLTGNVVSPSGDPVIYLTLADAQKVQFQKNNEAIRNERERLQEQLSALLPQNVDEGRIADALANDTHIVNTSRHQGKEGLSRKGRYLRCREMEALPRLHCA